jgi:hypothetical protein
MSFVNPMDTGYWEMYCNRTGNKSVLGSIRTPNTENNGYSKHSQHSDLGQFGQLSKFLELTGVNSPFAYQLNCSQPMQIGTYGALNHLIVPSDKIWGTSAVSPDLSPWLQVFRFLYEEPTPTISVYETFQYFEVDFAGTVLLPQGVNFVIASFPTLFGTPSGRVLQQWCVTNDWPLVWVEGLNCTGTVHDCISFLTGGESNITIANLIGGRTRLLDPVVNDKLHTRVNMTIQPGALKAFDDQFELIGEMIQNKTLAPNYLVVLDQRWTALWDETVAEMPQEATVKSVRARQCANAQGCIGVTAAGADCVCRSAQHYAQA